MAVVYRGTQLAVGRSVAVKVIQERLLGDAALGQQVLRRFKREAVATSRLSHPHTVRCFDFGETADGFLYLVLELLDGQPLDQVLAATGPLEPTRVARIGRQICRSLAEAHGRGIIHRDLKPSNVFLCRYEGEDDFVKVMDFGLARLGDTTAGGATAGGLTVQGSAIGTPFYMAPEQSRATTPVGPGADLYSLGVMLFELLTGEVPFPGDTALTVAMRHLRDPAPPMPLRDLHPGLARAWRGLVYALLEKTVERRPARASDVATYLSVLERGEVPRYPWKPGEPTSKTVESEGQQVAGPDSGTMRWDPEESRSGGPPAPLPEPGAPRPRAAGQIAYGARTESFTQAAARVRVESAEHAHDHTTAAAVPAAGAAIGPDDPTLDVTASEPEPLPRSLRPYDPRVLGVAAGLLLGLIVFSIGLARVAGSDGGGDGDEAAAASEGPGSSEGSEPAAADAGATAQAGPVAHVTRGEGPPDAGPETTAGALDPSAPTRLLVGSEPPGASVSIGETVICKTPCVRELSPSSEPTLLRLALAGHEDAVVIITRPPGETVVRQVSLPRRASGSPDDGARSSGVESSRHKRRLPRIHTKVPKRERTPLPGLRL